MFVRGSGRKYAKEEERISSIIHILVAITRRSHCSSYRVVDDFVLPREFFSSSIHYETFLIRIESRQQRTACY